MVEKKSTSAWLCDDAGAEGAEVGTAELEEA